MVIMILSYEPSISLCIQIHACDLMVVLIRILAWILVKNTSLYYTACSCKASPFSGGFRGCKCTPLWGLVMYFGIHNLQWRIQRGFHWFHGTSVFKDCLRKYYAQRFYLHYAYTGATHFSFNSSNNARVSTPVSRIRRAHGLRARKYYQKYVETTEAMSETSERIKAYSCIAPSAARDGEMQSVWEHLFSRALRG